MTLGTAIFIETIVVVSKPEVNSESMGVQLDLFILKLNRYPAGAGDLLAEILTENMRRQLLSKVMKELICAKINKLCSD